MHDLEDSLEQIKLNDAELTSLDLSGQDITLSDLELLVAALKDNNYLTELDVSDNSITCDGAKLLAQVNKLKIIDISRNQVGTEGVKALGQGFFTKITLDNNKIEVDGMCALANNAYLKELSLDQTNIANDAPPILFKNTISLNKLSLCNNELTGVALKDFPLNKTIKTLLISQNLLQDEDVKELAASKTLRTLIADTNSIGDKGVKRLAKTKNLLELSLFNNKIGNKGAQRLAQNTTLHSLNLNNNQIGDEGAKPFLENKTLLNLSLYNNFVSSNIQLQLDQHFQGNKNRVLVVRNQVMMTIFIIAIQQYRNSDDQVHFFQLHPDMFIKICSYLNFPSSRYGWHERTAEPCAKFIFDNVQKYQDRLEATLYRGNGIFLSAVEKNTEHLNHPFSFNFQNCAPNLTWLRSRASSQKNLPSL